MGIFDTENYGSAQKYYDQYAAERDAQAGQYDPWVQAGDQGRNRSMSEYERLLNNPNYLQDMVAGGFYESPYQAYMQDMLTKKMNMNAANTGMLGSGAANRALQGELTAMTGQFMNDYITRGMGSYGQGLTGMGQMAQMGYGALNDQSAISNEASEGRLQGGISEQDAKAKRMGGIGGLIGSALPFVGGLASMIPGIGPYIGAGMGAMGMGGGNPKQGTFDLGRSY